MKLTGYRNLLFAAALSLLPIATTTPAHAAGTLTVALETDDGSWDPIDTFTLTWGRIGSNLYDGLVLRGPDLKLYPGLATSWQFLDDNKRIRFTLRKGVKFHDGEDFNAAAVKFTFDRLLGPDGAKGPQQANYTSIGSVNVVDDYTVDFILKTPDPVLITKLAGYGAMIVPPKYIQEKGDAYFNLHPVGTGAFKFVDYKPKVSLTLEANPDYWGGAPKLSGLVYRFIPEAATQVSELQSGGIDIATLVPISLIDTIKGDPKLEVESITGPDVVMLRFNSADGITKDPSVRKAMIEAIDRDAIIEQIMQGNAKPIASLQSSLSFGYDPNLKPLPFDPAAAKAALDKAGVKPGTNVELSFIGTNATFREVAQTVAAYLQAVGINVSLKSYESNVYYTDLVPHGKTGPLYQYQWGGWTFDFDNTAYLLYHSGQFWNPYIKDAKLDQMLEAQRATYNVDERKKILNQIADYAADQAYEIPLYNSNTLYAINKRVHNLAPTPDVRFRFLDTTVE
ncbi:ABC transporter substrate-binding protein [Rhizobium mayense]|uniref:ABC transporter substrate-binding protein n=1 Tax=Rhizobium mayense TaxID=1312184 RepID=A0ABT7K1V1_9HYPH|nr:ABC transporter substrate-binding protein [Rhizobium mayense]MDL2401378.1 ABC transporter substrate-binding protein [Rhizobium mayense]